MKSIWREHAAKVISRAITELAITHPDLSGDALKKKISADFYPFGPREYHPYKIWLDELKRTFERHPDAAVQLPAKPPSVADYNDMPLFGGE